MALILNIDASGTQGLVALAKDGLLIGSISDPQPMQHASFIQPAIGRLMAASGYSLPQLDAVAVCNGPGSYTGLRVGLASAKGLCHALGKPLITLSTLQVMAASAIAQAASSPDGIRSKKQGMRPELPPDLFCPMIDARRMEVFFAVYDKDGLPVLPAATAILDSSFLKDILDHKNILFFGNGSAKWEGVCEHLNAAFMELGTIGAALCKLSFMSFLDNSFDSLPWAEPFYCKEFYNPKPIAVKQV